MSSLAGKIRNVFFPEQKTVPPDSYVPSEEFINRVNHTLGGKPVFSDGEKEALRSRITAESCWNTDLVDLEPKGITHQVIFLDGIPLITLPLEKHPALDEVTKSNSVVTGVKSDVNKLWDWCNGR